MKKLISVILLLVAIGTVISGCGNSKVEPTAPGAVITTDEDAIKQVIKAYYHAGFLWDFQTMKDCVTEELPVYDPYESAKNNYVQGTERGFMVEADVDQFMELERNFQRKMGEKVQYSDWIIQITEDTATATLTVAPSGVDFEKIKAESGEMDYRDKLFTQVCGMDEAAAKQNYTPEEFSAFHLQVQEQEFQLWLENLSDAGQKITVQLKKADQCWRISRIAPAV